jgi:deoxyribodipyrimidine photo-lyase
MPVDRRRIEVLREEDTTPPAKKAKSASAPAAPVVLWMSRDQRVADNWALIHAQQEALSRSAPLCVVFCLTRGFLGATFRHYDFMIQGLKEVEIELRALRIEFVLLQPAAGAQTIPATLSAFLGRRKAQLLVTDFSPLRLGRQWKRDVLAATATATTGTSSIPVHQVDAHNIVPVWVASDKIEYAARTIRRKIEDKLGRFLTDFPAVERHPFPSDDAAAATDHSQALRELYTEFAPAKLAKVEAVLTKYAGQEEEMIEALTAKYVGRRWDAVAASLDASVDRAVAPVSWCTPGPKAARATLQRFIDERLVKYGQRNDPNAKGAVSDLSPYLHFGNIAAQRCALEAGKVRSKHSAAVKSFLEELIIRRELADNYCYYNEDGYDRLGGLFPQYDQKSWAQKSLALHRDDPRSHVYSAAELETGETHDDLWNAAQMELVHRGKMHGFMRMYWAKKILEWTASPEEALAIAIKLNDRFSLDGRDPNGYVGCAWSIGGVHDQGWKERDVFGKIRYMNYAGCKRKFDVAKYVRRMARLIPK